MTGRTIARRLLTAGLIGSASVTGAYLGLVTGRLTVDLGVGRRVRPLGPLEVTVAAPPEVVFAVASAPYAERRARAMAEKVDLWERGDGMVLAAHHTPVAGGLTALTVETVSLDPPHEMGFRLLRGPVPHVRETFRFDDLGDGRTRLRYEGELGTDLWGLGAAWGELVAGPWEATVAASFEDIRVEAERRAGRSR